MARNQAVDIHVDRDTITVSQDTTKVDEDGRYPLRVRTPRYMYDARSVWLLIARNRGGKLRMIGEQALPSARRMEKFRGVPDLRDAKGITDEDASEPLVFPFVGLQVRYIHYRLVPRQGSKVKTVVKRRKIKAISIHRDSKRVRFELDHEGKIDMTQRYSEADRGGRYQLHMSMVADGEENPIYGVYFDDEPMDEPLGERVLPSFHVFEKSRKRKRRIDDNDGGP